MYYRGANAAIICYDITSAPSWNMVDSWLQELRRNMTTKLGLASILKCAIMLTMAVVHLVGGKLDLVLQNPALRAVPFEEACSYAAENLDDLPGGSPSSPSSSLYGQDDLSCHEVSAKDDTGDSPPPVIAFLTS